jgi:hypothetical protein
MQTDIWLADEIDDSELCPLCSQPLKNGSTTCFSCGFSTKSPTGTSVWIDPAVYEFPHSSSQRQSHETRRRYARELPRARGHPDPITPIPQRASAQSANAIQGAIVKQSKSQKKTNYGLDKQPREEQRSASNRSFESSARVEAPENLTVWEYETPDFQASSSLPALSLLISDEPTQPELEARGKVTRRLPHVEEIITVPSPNVVHSITTSRSLAPIDYQHDLTPFYRHTQSSINILLSQEVDATSWTAGKASKSSHAQLISSRSKRKHPHVAVSFNPIDRVRWWLLRPGHLEFILWLGGTVLLVAVTCVLLLVTAFSFEWVTPGFINATTTNTTGTSTGSGQQSTIVATPELILIRIDKGPILPGQSMGLRGQGFSPHSHVRFLFDGTQQLFDQIGQSASTQANAQGVFITSVVLDSNLPWHPGPHIINAQDLTTKRMATLYIILSPAPIGKGTPNTPVPSYPPNATPPALTPIPSVTSGQPTPVGQPPVTVTPTSQPVTPTPSPTVGTTPTVTPTVGTSPTAVPTGGTTQGVTTVGSGLGNALDHAGDTYLAKNLTHLSPWVWLMIACYCLSMVLLGFAGVLHKRHQ